MDTNKIDVSMIYPTSFLHFWFFFLVPGYRWGEGYYERENKSCGERLQDIRFDFGECEDKVARRRHDYYSRYLQRCDALDFGGI